MTSTTNFAARTLLASAVALVLAGSAWAGTVPQPSARHAAAAPLGLRGPRNAVIKQSTIPGSKTKTQTGQAKNNSGKEPVTLQTVVVDAGIAGSIKQSILDKKVAPQIMDAITATEIGQLPDASITDSLQRIPGVQINRSAGVGSSLNINGLPQVASMLNGEVFLSADNIDSQQPNFVDIPAQLFRSVEVLKSPTAGLLNNGISGTVNLKTWHPLQLKQGWTVGASVNGTYGNVTKKVQPQGNLLVSFNHDDDWGVLFSVAGSDVTRNDSSAGLESEGPVLYGENSESALQTLGFLGAFNFYNAPVPSAVHQLGAGNVDVNGDGESNGAFFAPLNPGVSRNYVHRKQAGATLSFQAKLGNGFTLGGTDFYTHQNGVNNQVQFILASTQWQHYGFVPLTSQDTGVSVTGPFASGGWSTPQELYATTAYRKWPGEMASQSQALVSRKQSNNFNLQLNYDDGGAFTGDLRWVSATARATSLTDTVEFTDSDGTPWANPTFNGNTVPANMVIRPAALGGDLPFNPDGVAPESLYGDIYMNGSWPRLALGPKAAAFFANGDNYRIKNIDANGNSEDTAGMNVVRADGHYFFNDQANLQLNFGVRNSVRTGRNISFNYVGPVYAGMGASDPGGCLVGYKAADQVMSGAGIQGACMAGNAEGFFRSNVYDALPPSQWPAVLADNMKQYTDLGGSGLSVTALDPSVLDNVLAFQNSLYPGEQRSINPTASWNVLLKETTAYIQADFDETSWALPVSGNIGVRAVRTSLGVTQHINGKPRPYGLNYTLGGSVRTKRQYTDLLPAVNVSLHFTRNLKLRLAYSKNMMPLNLDQWGGGLSLSYNINTTAKHPGAIVGGSSSGNPDLKPWRSTNFNASLEYYGKYTTASISGFRIKLASFVQSGTVTECDLPDLDGVVRHRCVPISSLLQGKGATLHGFGANVNQNFKFLSGIWSHFGVNANFTYSPSSTDNKDLAGNAVPFQNNSKYEGNLVLWFQNQRWQFRVAGNYRSKEAVANNYGGIAGLEEYESPTKYVDASASYQVNKVVQVYVQGVNLTDQKEKFYLTWPAQPLIFNASERRFIAGVRVKW